jgi:phosphoglucosamine mutase
MINVHVQPGTDWKQNQALQDGIASAEARLQGRGRVLIRASGTEPLLRVMVEADDAALAEGLAKELAALV